MRTQLAAFIALGLNCALWSSTRGLEPHRDREPLPATIGRFCGIGYSAGYHARYPSRAGRNLFSRDSVPLMSSARAVYSDPAYAPTAEIQWLETVAPSPLGGQPEAPLQSPAAFSSPTKASSPASPAQPPHTEGSPSDRAGFIQRLPNIRAKVSVSDLPSPPPAQKKNPSVARASVLERSAR